MIDFQSSAFGPYALGSAILVLQLIVLALYTGTVRALRKKWVNPEDAKLNKGEHTEQDHADVQRVHRAHYNLLENAVPFFVIGALYAATGATHKGAVIYTATFVGVRLLHTVFYLLGIQPFRTMMFAIGALACIGMAVQVLMVLV
jgi:glutathione S-transferase